MAFGARHSRALVLGASAFSFALMSSGAAFTQALEAEAVTRSPEQKKQIAEQQKALADERDDFSLPIGQLVPGTGLSTHASESIAPTDPAGAGCAASR